MTVLSDNAIRSLCENPYRYEHIVETKWNYSRNGQERYEDIVKYDKTRSIDNKGYPMIEPFVNRAVRVNQDGEKIISYGLSSYGYDVRLSANDVKLFSNVNGTIVDPMAMDASCLLDADIKTNEKGFKYFILPPSSYALGYTIEYFYIPRNVNVICVGKSTLARAGALVNVTPIEAEFNGNVVIEISNGSTLPIMVYLEMGIAQFQFLEGINHCDVSYADRNGKYQGQTGLTLARL